MDGEIVDYMIGNSAHRELSWQAPSKTSRRSFTTPG